MTEVLLKVVFNTRKKITFVQWSRWQIYSVQ